jgi:bacteriorhodopsin
MDEHWFYLAGVVIFLGAIIAESIRAHSKTTAQIPAIRLKQHVGMSCALLMFSLYILLFLDECHSRRDDNVIVIWPRFVVYALVYSIQAFYISTSINFFLSTSLFFSFAVFISMALTAVATMVRFNGRWIWFAISVFWFAIASLSVFVKYARRDNSFSYRHLVIVCWSLNHVVWFFGSAALDRLDSDIEALLFLVLDIVFLIILNGNFMPSFSSLPPPPLPPAPLPPVRTHHTHRDNDDELEY